MSRLKTSLFLFFGVWLAILVVAGVMLSRTVRMLREDAHRVFHTHEVLEAAQTTLATLVDAESGERGYLVTNNPVYLEPYQVALRRLRGDTGRLESLIQDNPRQIARIQGLKQLIAARLGELKETIVLNGLDPAAARRLLVTNLEKNTMDGIRDRFEALRGEELGLLGERERADRRSYRIATLAGIIYGLLGLAGVGGLLIQVLRHARDRERFELGLEAQRALLEVTLRSIGDAIITTDAAGAVVFMNPVAEALTGWQAGAAAGRPLDTVFPIINERTGEPACNPAGRVLSEGVVLALGNHTALVGRDGRAIPIEDSAAPIKDPAGTVIGMVLVFHDVTGRRRAEAELARSESRYRTLFSSLIEGFCVIEVLFDPDGRPVDHRFLETNPAFEAQTGLVDAKGKRIRELAPDNESYWIELYGRVAVTGEPARFVNEAKALNRWFDVSAYRVDGAGSNRVAILFNDVSDARRAEEAMRESDRRFRSLANAMPQLCWMADGDGWITWYNQRWYEYTGTTPEQMEGWGWQSVHDPAVLPEVVQRWKASIATGAPFDMVFPLRGRDGEFRPFLTRVMPVTDGDGKVQGWFGTNTDISDRIRAEEERRRMEERATQMQRLESLGVLVAGVAHNFNNILAVIMGMASIQEDLATGAEELEAMKMIVTACERGRGLVQSLTQFARPALAQQVALDLNRLTAEVAALLGSTSPKSVALACELAEESLWIIGDPGNLSTALMNLGLNSLDAMPEGGTLTFRTRSLEPGWVEVAVADSGEGMTPEVLTHATEPFFTTRPVGKGTGLGLSMAHGVAKAHGGALELSSTPGQGSQVRIRLPRFAAPVEVPPAPGLPPAVQAFRVLLVDDEDDVRILMTRMLGKAGIEQVTAVPGGPEALAAIHSGAVPDLVILDQNMPGMDGVQTLALIRQSHPGLPVLIASGQPGIREWDAFRQERVAVISKPFSLKEIQAKLAEMGVPGPLEGG